MVIWTVVSASLYFRLLNAFAARSSAINHMLRCIDLSTQSLVQTAHFSAERGASVSILEGLNIALHINPGADARLSQSGALLVQYKANHDPWFRNKLMRRLTVQTVGFETSRMARQTADLIWWPRRLMLITTDHATYSSSSTVVSHHWIWIIDSARSPWIVALSTGGQKSWTALLSPMTTQSPMLRE